MEKIVDRGVINLEKLKPNPANPRSITNKQFEKLKKSILEFEDMLQISPVVVDENWVIIGGNMRYKALKDLDIKETPYVKIDGLTEEQKKEFVIKDNVNFGDWDWNVLLNDFPQPKLLDLGLFIPEHLIDNNDERKEDKNTLKEQFDTWLNSDERTVKMFLSNSQWEEVKDQLDTLVETLEVDGYSDVLVVLLDKYFNDNNLIPDRR
jgi:hypothetical protein